MEQQLYRLGKHPPLVDARTLRFARYLKPSIPKAPATCPWYNKAKLPWGMMGNDKWGDCAFAAIAHARQNMTAVNGSEKSPDPAAVVAAYLDYTGGRDTGSALLDVMKIARRKGIVGFKVGAFAALDCSDKTDFLNAIHLTGGAYIGLALPKYAVDAKDILAVPWTATRQAPNPNNGHCVELVGYTGAHAYCVTWGALKNMTWAFLARYCDEAYAMVSPDWFTLGRSPDHIDMQTLQADLAAL